MAPFTSVLAGARAGPSVRTAGGAFRAPRGAEVGATRARAVAVEVRALSVEVAGYGAGEWYALGVAASNPDTIEGGHAESLCVLADEAKGLDANVVAALHGSQTDVGGDRLYVLASVPGGPAGPFYDAFRKGTWRTFHVSAADSERVSRSWVEERRQEWGEHSPLYKARVLGEFPEEAEGTVYPLDLLEAAVGRSLM